MAKFNVGDKVRIIDNDGYADVEPFKFVGSVGEVVDLDDRDVVILVPGSGTAFWGQYEGSDHQFPISEDAVEHAD